MNVWQFFFLIFVNIPIFQCIMFARTYTCLLGSYVANTRHRSNVLCSMLGHRLQQGPNIKPPFIYGIRRSLIVIGFITGVKQRRARLIIGWVTAWDFQVLYTLVRLREPRKSDGSPDWPRVGRKRTSMDVGAVSIRRDPRKSTMCEYLAHKTNLLGMKIAWCASMAAKLYISQETELEFEMITGLAKLLSMFSALNSLRLYTCAI